MKNKIANRIAPDGTPRPAASQLGVFCLPKSHKKDAKLIWVIGLGNVTCINMFLTDFKNIFDAF